MRGIINGQNVCLFRNGQPQLQQKKLQASRGTHANNKNRPRRIRCFTLHINECKVGNLKMQFAEKLKPLLSLYARTWFRLTERST